MKCTVPTGAAAHAAARPSARPAPIATGSEAQLDRYYEERAESAVVDALRTLGEWSTVDEVKALVSPELRWQVPALLERLAAAGKADRARPRLRGRVAEMWKAKP